MVKMDLVTRNPYFVAYMYEQQRHRAESTSAHFEQRFRSSCADPDGGDRGSRPPPEKSQKISFLSNTSLDPLLKKKAINVGPPSAHQRNAI